MKPYLCIDPIKHDGEDFAPGAPIELDDEQAAPLLAASAVRLDVEALLASQAPPEQKPAPKKPAPKKPGQPEQPEQPEQSENIGAGD